VGIERYPAPPLPGAFQTVNAGVALACAEHLDGFGLDARVRAIGLGNVDWPARLQRLTGGHLERLLPKGWELWLDGGHNAAAGEALAEVARAWSDRPLHLVYGMLNTKAARDFVQPLAPLAQSLHAVAIPGVEASLSAQDAAAEAASAGIHAQTAASVEDALHAIAAHAGDAPPPARVLICGSLYLAGHVLAQQAASAQTQ
jgi:dihydrofolate synthase/folylpolyglutamate synthase